MDNEITIDTIARRVVVFGEGAQVKRVGKVKLDAGTRVIKVVLPAGIDKGSLRVTGEGPGSIVNMVVKTSHETKEISAKARELVEKIKEMEREKAILEQTRARGEAYLEQVISGLRAATQKGPLFAAAGKTPLSSFEETEEFLLAKFEILVGEVSKATRSIEALASKIESARVDLDDIGGKEGTASYTELLLEVHAKQADEFEFHVTYVFKGASNVCWEPLYEINLKESEPEARISLNGEVYNRTGEEWNDISLVLSTASMVPVSLTEPSPCILRAHRVVSAPVESKMMKKSSMGFGGSRRSMPEAVGSAMDDDMLKEAEEEAPAEEPEPDVDMDVEETVGHEVAGIQAYEIGGKVSIANGKKTGPFLLQEFTLACAAELFWSPQQGETVIARSEITNGVKVLLPGRARTYIDGEFAGESTLPLVRPLEKFTAGIRESKVLKAKKELTDRGRKTAGAIVKDKITRHYAYCIKLDLLHPIEAKLLVMDAIPHSDSTRIAIENIAFSKEPDKNVVGVLTWAMKTKEMKTVSIDYSFDVRYDKDVVIEPPLP